MNFNKALQFITDNNIQPEAVFELVEKVKTMDLSDENNIRNVIKDVSKLAGKPIDKEHEDNIPWAEGQAEAYVQKIAQLNRRSKIKSIDIKLYKPEDDRPNTVPPSLETLLVGHIEFTR
jgi:hypothetical protein